MEIPVYLFTGFLESGKTQFIQGTLEDKKFDPNPRTLLLMCEEGIEEYNPDLFVGKNVYMEKIESIEELTTAKMVELAKNYKIQRVLVEYNGMWSLNELYNNMPENWMIYQEIFFANSENFINYNANMRQLTVDKLQSCELIALNRVTDKTNKDEIHKIIRGINRRTDIIYEYLNGEIEYDETVDPLPFDINSPVITVEDKDFALWYRDLMEEEAKYEGKTVKFKGLVARADELGPNTILIGRHIMTCCEADIAFKPIVCEAESPIFMNNKSWQTVVVRIAIEKHKLYKSKAPVLKLISFTPAEAPEKEVATFY
ncbi:MAG: GTPase [Bacillota bacterium]|nr:GTPase [Bacillota bacterium]